jgi:hypothetical protein
MQNRICSIPRCGNTRTPHRARAGDGYWCDTCLSYWKRTGKSPAGRQGLIAVPDGCVVIEDGARCGRDVAVKSRGWCGMHRSVAKNNGGDPTARKRARKGGLMAIVQEAARATGNECVIPPGWNQRPKVKLNGVLVTATKAVWILAHGEEPCGDLLHTCNGGSGDNGCISVQHLYVGDVAQNARDMVEAGRSLRGERHHQHVLATTQVHEIRRRHVRGRGPYDRGNTRDLADEYGVAMTTIRAIIRGENWGWLEEGGNG